jgi:hypothetical protein
VIALFYDGPMKPTELEISAPWPEFRFPMEPPYRALVTGEDDTIEWKVYRRGEFVEWDENDTPTVVEYHRVPA